ncbi:MAG TPA: hypothetical protein VI076_11195 [Actinopolymorphaceae bacterium]
MTAESTQPVRVLVYSDDRNTREQVRLAIGKRPAADLPPFDFVECATQYAVLKQVDSGNADRLDLLVLDGEAVPTGGMGLCRQLKDEIYRLPPVLVLTGRPQDAWLATWSRAEAALPHPIDPITLTRTVVELVRQRRASTLTRV